MREALLDATIRRRQRRFRAECPRTVHGGSCGSSRAGACRARESTASTAASECTYADADRYFSHRRDGVTGRQATLIWLERIAGAERPLNWRLAHPHLMSIRSVFSKGYLMRMDKLTTKFQAGTGGCPVARRGPRQSIHRARAPHGGAARPAGRHRAAAAREGRRSGRQIALGSGRGLGSGREGRRVPAAKCCSATI